LLFTANVVSSSLRLSTLMMEAIRSSETSVLKRATRRNIPEDGILHSRRSKKSQILYGINWQDLWRRINVLPVRYELGFDILEDGILHSHSHGNLDSCNFNQGVKMYIVALGVIELRISVDGQKGIE
jgi:hypothetical protein